MLGARGRDQLAMDLVRFGSVVIRKAKHRWWRRCWFALVFPVRWVDGSVSRAFLFLVLDSADMRVRIKLLRTHM